jgi:hypothetical protein
MESLEVWAPIHALATYLADSSQEIHQRGYAAMALAEIGKRHPESFSDAVSAISKQLETPDVYDPTLNAFLISHLVDHKAVGTLPLIERAYKARRVDESVINLDDVYVELGLKEREVVPNAFSNLFETSPNSPEQEQMPFAAPNMSYQPPNWRASGKTIKFSGKKITKKHKNKKR